MVAEWTLGNGRGPRVLLNDHMDTVGVQGMEIEPFSPDIREGRMYGRGTSDTKGNLVSGLMAVEALLERGDGLNGSVVFESVVDEECNGGGAGTLACCLAGVTGDFAICLDGCSGTINVGCDGIATALLRVFGKSGHGSFGGAVNAIDKAVAVKQAVDAFAAEHAEAFPGCLLNIGVFRSGTLPAIVPGEAEIQINMNYDISDAERALAQGRPWNGAEFRERFEAAMADMAGQDPWFAEKPVEVQWLKDLYPFACDPGLPLIQTVRQAAAEVSSQPPEVTWLHAWFDAAHLARQLGIPTVGVGSGAPGVAHAGVEYAVIDDLVTGAQIVALALSRILQGD